MHSTAGDRQSGASGPAGRLSSLARVPRWLRIALLSLAGAAALGGMIVLAYQLALARVPQHRATLERLVRAQTGLDVRFSELGLRWGWYGPEVVFRRVELGEPGHSNVLLRAPQLVVRFDTWKTMRTGKLQAGRITLVAPDIDLERPAASPRPGRSASAAAPLNRARILQRWQDGRIDIESGTLRLTDPAGSASPVSIHVRRASLRRSGDQWNASALLFLPDRLGRTARIVASLTGDLAAPQTLSGTVRVEGFRLIFAGWRELLGASRGLLQHLPQAGGGNVTWSVKLEDGRIVGADGELDASGLVFGPPPWREPEPAGDEMSGVLRFARLGGEWRIARSGADWRVQIDDFVVAQADEEASRSSLAIDVGEGGGYLRGKLDSASLGAVVAVTRWLAPDLELGGLRVAGKASDIEFEWSRARPPDQRLQASLRVDDLTLAAPTGSFELTGLSGQVTGTERDIDVRLESSNARLDLARAPSHPVTPLRVASELRISRTVDGWEISGKDLELAHEDARLLLSGSVRAGDDEAVPHLALRGALTDVDVTLVQQLLAEDAVQAFGSVVSRLRAGHIGRARFTLDGAIDEIPFGRGGKAFSGALELNDAVLAGDDSWPETEGMRVRLEWSGARMRAAIEEAVAGPLRLASAEARWDVTGKGRARIAGQATGRIEAAMAWLDEHPQLRQYAPRLPGLTARGEALFDFTVAEGKENGPARVQVAASLEGAQLELAPGLPPLESVRGAVAFDGGRLQPSTLTAVWLGGPMTLRVSESREGGAQVFSARAQGFLDSRRLAALAVLKEAAGGVEGQTEWKAELSYRSETDTNPSRWHLRAASSLLGVTSRLPAPLAKVSERPAALRIEGTGQGNDATLRVNLERRFQSAFALWHEDGVGWHVERGAVRLGTGAPDLPEEPVIAVSGHVDQLALPEYVYLWRQLRRDITVPQLQADLSAEELLLAGRSFGDVSVRAHRGDAGLELRLESAALQGLVRWPDAVGDDDPVEVRFARLHLPEPRQSGNLPAAVAALAPSARVSVDSLVWEGRPLGRFTAQLETREDSILFDDLRLAGGAHDGLGSVQCQSGLTSCRIQFELASRDVAATLRDFGFRDDVSASHAVLGGELEWQPVAGAPWLAALTGKVSMRLADGTTRTGTADDAPPFGVLAVPALVQGVAQPAAGGIVQPGGVAQELRFARLEADFELRAGSAYTTNLHFDGDAEILMRGRTGLVARDYDHEVWVLRGEDRLPAALRHLGPTPSVAAAWMRLRELLGTDADPDRPRPVVRLSGTWREPVIAAENSEG